MVDIHNHTTWSDGLDSIEEIVINAINRGISTIGISDHFNTNKCSSVSIKNLNRYLNDITIIKNKYKDKVMVVSGIEICSLPYPQSFMNIPFDIINMFDFVLIEYLDLLSPNINLIYLKEFLLKITCKKGLAHTDLLKLSNKFGNLDKTVKFLKDNDIFWELNSNSCCDTLYNMTSKESETINLIDILNHYKLEVLAGSDTHALIDYEYGRLKKANELILNTFILGEL